MSFTLDMAQRLDFYKTHPVEFFADCLGRNLWEKQAEICESLLEYPETYVQSANGIGKTDVAGGLVPWWITTRRGIVITTANTWVQVETVLWERIKKLIKQAPVNLGLNPVGTKLRVDDNWFAIGLSTNEPDRFQGYHEAEVLVIVEEAGGMNMEGLWDALEGCLTGAQDRLLAIGNPTNRAGVFYKRCSQPDKDRNVIKVSAFDTPNLREKRVVIDGMITVERVERWRRQWGEDDPRWQSRVMGEFPTQGDRTLFPMAWLEGAMDYEGPDLMTGDREVGLDVARYGPDNNAMVLRDGHKLLEMAVWGGIDTMKTTGRLIRCLKDGSMHPAEMDGDRMPYGPPTRAKVDADGLGSGVFDRAAELVHAREDLWHVEMFEWRASAATSQPDEFANFKTEAYWHFRELLRTRNIDLSGLSKAQRETVIGQAVAVTYDVDSDGRIRLQEKRETKKQINDGKLDELEGLIIAFFDLEADDADNSNYSTNVSPYAHDDDRVRPGEATRQPGPDEDTYLVANVGDF